MATTFQHNTWDHLRYGDPTEAYSSAHWQVQREDGHGRQSLPSDFTYILHWIAHCKVFFVLCFNFCFPCLPPEAGTPLVYHGWICLKELIVHPWQLDIRYWDMIDTQLKKMPVCLCYRVISKQIDNVIFPMLCDGKYITMCTHCYYELWNWLASVNISLDLLFHFWFDKSETHVGIN